MICFLFSIFFSLTVIEITVRIFQIKWRGEGISYYSKLEDERDN